MDVIESPLNQAHQQGRQADLFVKKEKFEEAIGCHKKAAELLLGAMRTTHMQGALQSLTLQREFHLKQDSILRQKQRHALIANQKKLKKPHQLAPPGVVDHTDSTSVMTSNLESTIDSEVQFAARIAHQLTNPEQCADNTLIQRTMEECDSLLQMLNLRHHHMADGRACTTPDTESASHQNGHHQNGDQKPQENGVATPTTKNIEEKIVIEELRMHNVSLCGHIVDLLKEIDHHRRQLQHYRRENANLKEKLNRMDTTYMEDSTDSEKYYPVPVGMNLHDLPSLELPPLEMPKFDFSALKMDAEDGAEEEGQK